MCRANILSCAPVYARVLVTRGKKTVGDGSYRENKFSATKEVLEIYDKLSYEKAPRGVPWCAIIDIGISIKAARGVPWCAIIDKDIE